MPTTIPEPQPTDLANPVPIAKQPNIEDLAKQFQMPSQAAAQAPSPAAPNVDELAKQFQMPSAGPAEPDTSGVQAASLPVLPSETVNGQNFTTSLIPNLKNLKGNMKEAGTIMAASLSQNINEQLDIWQNAYGKKNAEIRNDPKTNEPGIWFKRPGDKSFSPVHASDQHGLVNFVMRNLIPTANYVGAGAATSPTLAGVAAAGAIGSTAIQLENKAVRGMLGLENQPEGGMLSNLATGQLDDKTGVGAQAADIAANAATAAGGGVAIYGGAKALGAIGSAGKDIFDWVKNSLPEERLNQIIALRQNVNDFVKSLGISGPLGTSTQAGKEIGPVIEKITEDHGNRIGAVMDDAMARTDGEKYKLTDEINSIKDMISKRGHGIKFGTRTLDIPAASKVEVPEGSALDQMMKDGGLSYEEVAKMADRIKATAPDSPIARDLADIESKGGPSVGKATLDNVAFIDPLKKPFGEASTTNAQKLVDEYNKLLIQNHLGGLDINELHDFSQAFGEMGKFNQADPRSGALLASYRNMQGIIANKRDTVLQGIANTISDNPELKNFYQTAFPRYTENINSLAGWVNGFDKSDAARFADGMISKTDVDSVSKLKSLLQSAPQLKDANSQPLPDVWNKVRGNWLGSIMNKSYSEKGFLDATGAIKEFDSYEPEIRNLMFDGAANYSKFKSMLQQLEKIPTQDFLGKGPRLNPLQTTVGYFMKGPMGKTIAMANTAKKAVSDALMQNAKVAEYMRDEGFLNLAKSASTPEDRMNIIKWGDQFSNLMANAKRIGDKYVPNNLATQVMTSQLEQSKYGYRAQPDVAWNKLSDDAKTSTPRTLQNPLVGRKILNLRNPLGGQ